MKISAARIFPAAFLLLSGVLCRPSYCEGAIDFHFDTEATTGPLVTKLLYGMNVARWDHSLFPTTTSQMLLTADRDAIQKLKDLEPGFLKYPGGNDADSYVWNAPGNNWYDMDTEEFLWLARTCGAPGFITVNFTQPASLAAEWVRFVNRLGGRSNTVPYWEVGDEVWGKWAKSHTDGADYGKKFREFSSAMKTEDPGIELAVNLALRGGDNDWTREALSTLGDSFDIVTITFFPQQAPNETDEALFKTPDKYREWFRALEKTVAELAPDRPRPKYCLVGFNSTAFGPGPQTVQMANGVYMAQMFGALAETRTDMSCWWAFHNAYPPRGGDFGVLTSDGKNTPHYTYWVFKLLSRNFLGKFLAAEKQGRVEFYATRRDRDTVCALLINTSTQPSPVVRLRWTGFTRAADLPPTESLDIVTSKTLGIETVSVAAPAKENRARSAFVGSLPPYSVAVLVLKSDAAEHNRANVAPLAAVSVSSSNRSFDYKPEKMTDGNAQTYWAAADWLRQQGKDRQWVELRFPQGAERRVDTIEIEWGPSFAKRYDVNILKTDGKSELVASVGAGNGSPVRIEVTKSPELEKIAGIRLDLIEGQAEISSYEIREIRLLAPPEKNN